MLKSISFCLLLCLVIGAASAQDKLNQKLDSLKEKNNLEEWLNTRLNYTSADPQQQLNVLMDTQKQMWRKPTTIPEGAVWLVLLSNQGYYQLQAGNILNSINSYEEAYTYANQYKVLQKGIDIVEYILKPLGNNYTRLGDYERAIYIQQQTINSLNPVKDADNVASLYSNMAISYYNMGNYAAAETCIDKGKAIVNNPKVKLQLNNTLADILYEKNDLIKASVLIKQNIVAQKKPDAETAYWVMGEYATLGNINIKTNELKAAQQNYSNALRLLNTYYPDSKQRERANLITQLGKIARLNNQPQQALTLLNQALQILHINNVQNQTNAQNIYGENKLVETFYQKALTYQSLNQNELALQNMRYALQATDQIRKEFADDKTKERLQQEAKQTAETTIEIAYNLYSKTRDKQYLNLILQISEQTKSRTLADQIQRSKQQFIASTKDTTQRRRLNIARAIIYNQKLIMTEKNTASYQKKIDALKFELALIDKKYREQSTGSVYAAADLLKNLPDSLHIMEFFWGERSVYIVSIKNRSVSNVSRIDSAQAFKQQLSQLINTYYQNGPDAMLNSPKAFYQLSNSIYSTLFKNTLLVKNEHLCIIPDDILGYLSFDGLITGGQYDPSFSQWPYLIKQVTTTYAFSLNTLTGKSNNTSKIFGGLFITHQTGNGKPIIAVEKEAAAIKKQVGGKYLYNDEVNTASFFNVFQNSSVLHISTHAYLSGTNKEPTLDFGKEKLYLFELLAKKQKPNLIVLSACGTGDGLLAQGEGIISLSRGFSAIGTPATIASLWNVNDDAVSGITASLYHYLTLNQSSGTALHNAKLNWLNTSQTSDAMYLPYYWDSLILMGANEPAHLKPPFNWTWVYGIVGVLVILGIGITIKKRHIKS
jgi:CHAT domain-containing protein